jgi:TonB family protein
MIASFTTAGKPSFVASGGYFFVGLIKLPSVFHTVVLELAMRHARLALRYALCTVIGATVGHATIQVSGESLFAQQSQSTPAITVAPKASPAAPSVATSPQPAVGQSPSSRFESDVRPAVIWVSVFDAKGNLLRTQTGFFISADGRLITTARAIEGGVNAVAKTADGGISNIIGIFAASKELDLAILQADVKRVPFLQLIKNSSVPVGTGVVVVGSGLAGNEGSAREMTIAAQDQTRIEMSATTPANSVGSPVVNENGEVVGVVISAGVKTVARPSSAVESFLSRIAADTQARWPAIAEASPTPRATPKPRLVYAPAPSFPPGVSRSGVSGTGHFRLSFDAKGNVTNVQVVKSTGNPYFDQSAIQTFRQWKSAPSQGWAVTVPVTFQTR